jgi:hypothetical protein
VLMSQVDFSAELAEYPPATHRGHRAWPVPCSGSSCWANAGATRAPAISTAQIDRVMGLLALAPAVVIGGALAVRPALTVCVTA